MQSKVPYLDVRIFSYQGIILATVLVLILSQFTLCNQNFQDNGKFHEIKFSQQTNDANGFKPIISGSTNNTTETNDIFTKSGKFKIFDEKYSSVLIPATYDVSNKTITSADKLQRKDSNMMIKTSLTSSQIENHLNNITNNNTQNMVEDISMQQFGGLILDYLQDTLMNKSYEVFPGFHINTFSKSSNITDGVNIKNSVDVMFKKFQQFLDGHSVSLNMGRAAENGRLFFFKGLKKILWPVFIGVQIAKTVLLALFLPSILGSLGKMLGKGLTSVSGFNHPVETVEHLDFKDNTYNFDQDNTKYNDYAYPQPEASTNHFATQMFDPAAINNNALSRFGIGDQKLMYVNSPGGLYNGKKGHTHNNVFSGNRNHFQVFHDIPASSLLLTNYDPFYSPLLSRLDAVFQQLGLGMGDESCKEKLVCLMYANPAKYAPYSNLVSAQLSRELNELRKPTSDNPDILRFFKYMKAAKDGQDGINCEEPYEGCTSFKESENPAMLSTYHDINKLVQARKLKR